MNWYIKHEKGCFIRISYTENQVEKTTRNSNYHGIYQTRVRVFHQDIQHQAHGCKNDVVFVFSGLFSFFSFLFFSFISFHFISFHFILFYFILFFSFSSLLFSFLFFSSLFFSFLFFTFLSFLFFSFLFFSFFLPFFLSFIFWRGAGGDKILGRWCWMSCWNTHSDV